MNGIGLYAKYAAEFNRNRDAMVAPAPFWNDLPRWKQDAWNAFAAGLASGREESDLRCEQPIFRTTPILPSAMAQTVSEVFRELVSTAFQYDDGGTLEVCFAATSSLPLPVSFSLSAPLPIQRNN